MDATDTIKVVSLKARGLETYATSTAAVEGDTEAALLARRLRAAVVCADRDRVWFDRQLREVGGLSVLAMREDALARQEEVTLPPRGNAARACGTYLTVFHTADEGDPVPILEALSDLEAAAEREQLARALQAMSNRHDAVLRYIEAISAGDVHAVIPAMCVLEGEPQAEREHVSASSHFDLADEERHKMNDYGFKGHTALTYAAENGSLRSCEYLLDQGAAPSSA